MDPNAVYNQIMETVDKVLGMGDREIHGADAVEVLLELCQDIDNLNRWLVRGGFLPEAWEQ
jgi:hypothetical protein